MRNYMNLLESKAEPVVETPVEIIEDSIEGETDPLAEAYRAAVCGDDFLAGTVLDEGDIKTAAAALAITGLMGGGAAWATGAAADAVNAQPSAAQMTQDKADADALAFGAPENRPSAYMEPTQGPFAPQNSRSAPPPQLVAQAREGRAIDQMPMEFRSNWAYLALTIWGEARSEERSGMLAVGNVMMNRMREGRWGDTIQSVVTANRVSQTSGKTVYQFSCWGDTNRASMMRMYELDRRLAGLLNSDPAAYQKLKTELESNEDWKAWLIAKDIAYKLLAGKARDNTGGANHYHTAAISPRWNENMSKLTKVGDHVFFTDRRNS